MSLLDDIENEAQQQRQQLGATENVQQRAYRQHTLPRLRQAYGFFNDLIGRLAELQAPVTCQYEIPGTGSVSDFAHSDYRIATDNSDQLTDLRITFNCVRDKAIEFVVRQPEKVQQVRDALHATGLSFDQRPGYVRGGRDQGTLFTVAGQVPVQIRLCAIADSLDLLLLVMNLPELGTRQKRLRPDQVNEDFLDQLGRFMLRRDNQLTFDDQASTSQPDGMDTESLRRQLKAKRLDPAMAQENKAPRPGFFRRLFRRH